MVRPRQLKETNMRQKNEPKSRPLYRLSFARKIGVDDKGEDKLGSAREIGWAWRRGGV